ncbi:MAG: hypothetical protein JXR77_01785 [Lentisphaeria bacterium]|nr:hypothetical protein [Lentisphaeria bacterium]
MMLRARRACFSLLELVVVMLLLTTAMAVVVPNLTGFFRGRRLDHEARRLWALTRHARDTAITRAVPVAVWIDPEERRYGLDAVSGYGFPVQGFAYDMSDDVEMEADDRTGPDRTEDGRWELVWWPDGAIREDSPHQVTLRDVRSTGSVWRLVRDTGEANFLLVKEQEE